jgi:ribosome biogenesis GTPase
LHSLTLAGLGWSARFARQLGANEHPARVSAVHRDRIQALGPAGALTLRCPDTGLIAVGDWVVQDGTRVLRVLDRASLLHRRAAGIAARDQLIAANVDTLGIVSSCNADFNPARLERFLALALASGALPLVVLTKADLAADAETFRRQAERLSPLLTALTLDATDSAEAARLAPWCRDGQTLALVGSSGVGKTTLQNALTGHAAPTQGIREDDAKGRHTTTARALRATRFGGWLIDTPGMRELGLAGAEDGIDTVFQDVADLAATCRFADCRHRDEPGCAVQAAIAAGTLDPSRLARWEKLRREDRHNAEALHEAHARERHTDRLYDQGRARSAAKRRGWD